MNNLERYRKKRKNIWSKTSPSCRLNQAQPWAAQNQEGLGQQRASHISNLQATAKPHFVSLCRCFKEQRALNDETTRISWCFSCHVKYIAQKDYDFGTGWQTNTRDSAVDGGNWNYSPSKDALLITVTLVSHCHPTQTDRTKITDIDHGLPWAWSQSLQNEDLISENPRTVQQNASLCAMWSWNNTWP